MRRCWFCGKRIWFWQAKMWVFDDRTFLWVETHKKCGIEYLIRKLRDVVMRVETEAGG